MISIILPTFNGEHYLREALMSILYQTYENFELIIVDDCSKDSTPIIIQEFLKIDSRIISIRNSKNLNLPASLNVGHSRAKGEFITWTSDDNLLKPNFLKILSSELQNKNNDLVYTNYDIINESGHFVRTVKVGEICNLPFGNVVGASFMYRRAVFNIIKYNENIQGLEDYDFWLRAAEKFKFIKIDSSNYSYRRHKKSLTDIIAANEEKDLIFSQNLKLVLSSISSFKTSSWQILYNFQRAEEWDWNFYNKNRIDFKECLITWNSKIKNADIASLKLNFYSNLRRKIILISTRREVLEIILSDHLIFFHKNLSKKVTLNILKNLIIK